MSKSVYHETDEKASAQSVNKPGYYAVIPADVRYDPELKPAAKLLYGEISALVNKEGFCFACNSYFAELYGVTERTISDHISQLQKHGYLHVELIRDQSGQVTTRRIWLSVSTRHTQPLEENFYTPGRNLREGIEENFQYTVTSNTDIKESIKEKSGEPVQPSSTGKRSRKKVEIIDPQPMFVSWIGTLPDMESGDRNRLYKAIMAFVQARADQRKPLQTKPAVTALCNKLMRYSNGGDLNLMLDMLDEAVLHGWQSIYRPKGTDQPAPDQGGGEKRWL